MRKKRVCDNINELYTAARENRKITFSHFGETCGACYTSARAWVHGKNDPQCALIPAIARYFDVPISRLFEGVE